MRRIEAKRTPARLLALSEDGHVRLLSPLTGRLLTQVPSPHPMKRMSDHSPAAVVSVSFSSLLNRIYCLLRDGRIAAYDASSHPCAALGEWTPRAGDPIPCRSSLFLLECPLPALRKAAQTKDAAKKTKAAPVRGAGRDPTDQPLAAPSASAVTGEGLVALLITGFADGRVGTIHASSGVELFVSNQVHTDAVRWRVDRRSGTVRAESLLCLPPSLCAARLDCPLAVIVDRYSLARRFVLFRKQLTPPPLDHPRWQCR